MASPSAFDLKNFPSCTQIELGKSFEERKSAMRSFSSDMQAIVPLAFAKVTRKIS